MTVLRHVWHWTWQHHWNVQLQLVSTDETCRLTLWPQLRHKWWQLRRWAADTPEPFSREQVRPFVPIVPKNSIKAKLNIWKIWLDNKKKAHYQLWSWPGKNPATIQGRRGSEARRGEFATNRTMTKTTQPSSCWSKTNQFEGFHCCSPL